MGAADRDGNGSITKKEMRHFVRTHRGSLRKQLAYEFDFKAFWTGMLEFDENHDGQVQINEFVRWYARSNGALRMAEQEGTLDPIVLQRKRYLEANVSGFAVET